MDIDLTKKDRLFLINQYEILKRLDLDNADHYDKLINILSHGYAVFYSKVDESISDDISIEDGHFDLDLLELYRFIEDYKKDHPDDKEIIEHPWAYFRGFSGNDETDHLSFVQFLIKEQGKFQEQLPYENKTDGFNSHFPSMQKYRPMVEMWRVYRSRRVSISREDILKILESAPMH